jgi:predicted MPP superfamily phosphohydrolase
MRMLIDGYASKRCKDERKHLSSRWNETAAQRVSETMLKEYEFDYRKPQSSEHRTEVLHPLFVRPPRDKIQYAHMTDVHCDTRHEVYAKNLAGQPAARHFNNWNETFLELYQQAQKSDAILITGDLIEYGRGHIERSFPLEEDGAYWRDRNWFVFYERLASGEEKYVAPVFTTLGNHDWRINPYGPDAEGAPAPGDLNLNNQDEVGQAWKGERVAVGDFAFTQSLEFSALKTVEESIEWYLLLINPFLDYIAQMPAPFDPAQPKSYSILMLDWGKDEDTMRHGFSWQDEQRALDEGAKGPIITHGAPWADGAISDLQKYLAELFLAQTRAAKVVTSHFQILGARPSWPQEAMYQGLIDPCPICRGVGKKTAASDSEDCPCVAAYPQPPDRATKHPIVAFGNPGRLNASDLLNVQPRYGSFTKNRPWFIEALVDSDVSAVLSGHIHRNTTFFIRQYEFDNGKRSHEAYLKRTKFGERAGIAIGLRDSQLDPVNLQGIANKSEQRPLFVNTVCGGPHAKDRETLGTTVLPSPPREIYNKVNKGRSRGIKRIRPGFRTIEILPNGDVASIRKVFSTRLDLIKIDSIDIVK